MSTPPVAEAHKEDDDYKGLLNKLMEIDNKIQRKEETIKSQLTSLEKEKLENEKEIKIVQEKMTAGSFSHLNSEQKIIPTPIPMAAPVETHMAAPVATPVVASKPATPAARFFRFKERGLLDSDSLYKNLKARESKGYIDGYVHTDEHEPTYKRRHFY